MDIEQPHGDKDWERDSCRTWRCKNLPKVVPKMDIINDRLFSLVLWGVLSVGLYNEPNCSLIAQISLVEDAHLSSCLLSKQTKLELRTVLGWSMSSTNYIRSLLILVHCFLSAMLQFMNPEKIFICLYIYIYIYIYIFCYMDFISYLNSFLK